MIFFFMYLFGDLGYIPDKQQKITIIVSLFQFKRNSSTTPMKKQVFCSLTAKCQESCSMKNFDFLLDLKIYA